MPFEQKTKSKNTDPTPMLAQHRQAADKSSLKGLDFGKQSELLAPKDGMPPLPQQPDPKVPVGGMPMLPTPDPKIPKDGMPQLPQQPDPKVPVGGMPKLPTPDPKVPKNGMPQLPQQPDPNVPVGGMPKLPGTPDPKVPVAGMPKLPLNPAEKKQAEEDRKAAAAKKAAEEKQKQNDRALRKYCVAGEDDPAAVQYCSVDKKASPADLETYAKHSAGMVAVLKNKTVYQRYKHMSDEQIANVILYTTNAAYPMNAILRGQLKSSKWMETYGKAIKDVVKCLKKMPKGTKNDQGKNDDGTTRLLDSAKAPEKFVDIGNVYRNDAWSGFFNPVFINDFKVGRALEEPGFFSSTLVEGSYMANAPVRRTIEGAKISRSLEDISAVSSEREALFPPGQRFSITGIEMEDTKRGTRTAVADPQALYPKSDEGKQAFNRPGLVWHIKLKHTGVAKGKKPDKKGKDQAEQDQQKPKGRDDGKPGFLEKLLGM